MRKFKVKNRQKRKYTRHINVPNQPEVSPLLIGMLPTVVLAIALVATMFINLNLREHTVTFQPQITLPEFTLPTFSLTEILTPLYSLPNLLTEPAAFAGSLGMLIATGIQQASISAWTGLLWTLALLDPRIAVAAFGQGIVSFFAGIGVIFTLLGDGSVRIGELFMQSLGAVGTNITAGANTVWSMTVEYTLRGASIISTSVVFVFDKIVQLLLLIFNAIAFVFGFIFTKIAEFLDAVWKVIMIPFNILAAIGVMMQPYVDILNMHIGMVGDDLANGFASFEELSSDIRQ